MSCEMIILSSSLRMFNMKAMEKCLEVRCKGAFLWYNSQKSVLLIQCVWFLENGGVSLLIHFCPNCGRWWCICWGDNICIR
jgi:hypothetical protein